MSISCIFLLLSHCDHRELPVLTPSVPPRPSSDVFSTRPLRCTGDSGDVYLAESVIAATGAQARWLGLPSERQFNGRGVSACATCCAPRPCRSEEHTYELQSLMRISYAAFCLTKKTTSIQ